MTAWRAIVGTMICGLASLAVAEDPPAAEKPAPPTQKELFEKFKQTMDKATLVGQFSLAGDAESKLHTEEYHILSVQKLDEGDFWLFKARMKYGDTDRTIPMPLEVKWAGSTPVITLDNVTILTLGTFDARVMIHDNQYLGTWRHGEHGGQLFGKIEHRDEPAPAEEKPAAKDE